MVKQMYTIAEVADLLRFSEQTVRTWVRNGQIRAVRPGLRAWRIPRAEVERLLAQYGVQEGDVGSGDTIEDKTQTPGRAAELVLNPALR